MWLARIAVRQPVLVNMLAILVSLAGILAFAGMTREELPEVEGWFAYTQVVYPGATAEDVEQLILRPIEDEIRDLEGMETHTATALESVGSVWVTFDPENPDMDRSTQLLAQAVARAELPEGAEDPVTQLWTQDFPAISVAVSADGDVPLKTIDAVVDALERELTQIEGVSEVLIAGLPEREVQVDVDRARAEALQLPLPTIAQAIEDAGSGTPAGALDTPRQQVLVRTEAGLAHADHVGDVVLRVQPDGSVLTVADVAAIEDGYAEPTSTARVDGRDAVVLTVMKTSEGDLIRVVQDVGDVTAAFRPPQGVTLTTHADASRALKRTLGDLYKNGAMGLALIALLLGIFLGFRNSFMAAAGLPVALAGGVLVMSALGITINMLSLFSLIIVLGIVVDDAIVVIENIVRYAEKGHSLPVAAVVGTGQVMVPVLAATLTTVSAFIPLLVMTGVMGKFFEIIPKVVAAVLVASLLEAFFILPSHMADFGKIPKKRKGSRVIAWLQVRYERLLTWCLSWRKSVVAGALVGSVVMVGVGVATLDVVLFTEVDADIVDVRMEMPVGTRLEETQRVLQVLEQVSADAVPDGALKSVTVQAGYVRDESIPITGTHEGMVTLDLEPWEDRDLPADDLALVLRSVVSQVAGPSSVRVVPVQQGPPVGKPVAIEVRGEDFEVLGALEAELRAALSATPGVSEISSDLDPGKQQVSVRVRPQDAARHGVAPAQVAGLLRYALAGGVPTTIRDGADQLDVRVRYEDPGSVASLGALKVPTQTGFVPLSELADLERDRGVSAIRHEEGVRRVMVTADVDPSVVTAVAVNLAMQDAFADVSQRHPGYTMTYGGEFEDVQESFASLFAALWISVLLIYTILGAQFRSFSLPLVVLAAVPFCFIGVVLGLMATGSPFGMLAGIGVVALTGIVVNDSLVLVDFINGKRRNGMPVIQAVVEGGRERMRPILLTSLTTIFGLLPLGLGLGGENPLLSPMATTVSWGLVFATGLTLLIVPCLYVLVDATVQKLTGKPTVAVDDTELDDLSALAEHLKPEWAEDA